MATLRPCFTHKPNLPPKPKPRTPNSTTSHTPAATRGNTQDTHTSSLTAAEDLQHPSHVHSSQQNRECRTQLQMDVGRSEPDGRETDGNIKAEHSVKGLTAPSLHSDQKHCHCICHLPQPGMRLMWVPVKDMEDKSPDVEASGRTQETGVLVEHSAVKSPTMPQCYSCRSFLLHHSPRDEEANEGVYESMEVFFSSPPREEPIYLQLQPSDHVRPTPSTRPIPPPRPESTLQTRQKERRCTQPVLAWVVSPRGGRLPIRAQSSCERGNGIPPLQKPKREHQKQDEITKTKDNKECDDQEWVVSDGHEQGQNVSSAPHRRCVSECVMHGEVTLWQHLGAVKQSGVLHTLTYRERQRQECMFEVMTSEASYLRSLNVLKDHFLGSRELDDTLVIHDKKSLFSNILQVHEVSQRFLQDLMARLDASVLMSDVCDIIHHHAHTNFSVYVEYVRNQVYQEKTYSKQCNRAFHTVMRRLEQSPLCNRLPFTSFMLLPFQRITRIKILIQSILKNTVEGSKEENTACQALSIVNEMIKEANTQVGHMKQMEELIHIATMLEFDKLKAIPLVSRTRVLEKQGELQELSKGGSMFSFRFRFNPIYIFLFNDIIILTRRNVNTERFLVFDHSHRSLVQVQPLEGETQLDHTFCLVMLENHQGRVCERVLKTNTESDLHRWMAAFPSVSVTHELKEERVYADWDCPQVQCIQQYVAKQVDELSLEPSDIINIIRKTNGGWWEGIRLSDQTTGWFPHEVVKEVTNEHQRRRNLREQYRIAQATNHSTTGTALLQAANHSIPN